MAGTLSYLYMGYLARVLRKSTYLAVSFLPHVGKCHFVSDSIARLVLVCFLLTNYVRPPPYIYKTRGRLREASVGAVGGSLRIRRYGGMSMSVGVG